MYENALSILNAQFARLDLSGLCFKSLQLKLKMQLNYAYFY